ncbi:MAG TPA: trypsin-like peptidase domain-containing protein [Burkholderiaceae bacterium]|jgi:S1-C subfamily serine protease
MKKSLYQILGVTKEASPEDISAAYEKARTKLAENANPDPNEAIILREAYQVLSHPQKRIVYDTSQSNRESGLTQAAAREEDPAASRRMVWLLGAVVAIALVGWVAIKKTEHRAQDIGASGTPQVAVPAQAVGPANQNAAARVAQNKILRALSPEELYATVAPSVALIHMKNDQGVLLGSGSGVLVGTNQVITNCHVARVGSQIELYIANEKVTGTVETADEHYDLCMLHVYGISSQPVTIAKMADVHTAEKVYAIGAPQGLDLTISEGIISSLRDIPDVGTVIQTSAAISPGSSGGGLFDNYGRLVGITTFQSRSGQNLNFAVPAEWIESMSNRSGGGVGRITMGGE